MQAMRHASADIHHSFEQSLAITRADAGRAEYMAFVCAMLGWLAPFEQLLWSREWPAEIQPTSRDEKRKWLECDILAGADEEKLFSLPRSQLIPKMDTLAECFGVAYVLEGAQMGSQVLGKTLGVKLHPLPARWLFGYGDTVATKWNVFRKSAEHHLTTDRDVATAAGSALATFESLDNWFKKTGTI